MRETKTNMLLMSIISSVAGLISIILLVIWGGLKNKNTDLLPFKVMIIFFIITSVISGVAASIYSGISARTNNEEVINQNTKDEDEGAVANEQEDK